MSNKNASRRHKEKSGNKIMAGIESIKNVQRKTRMRTSQLTTTTTIDNFVYWCQEQCEWNTCVFSARLNDSMVGR